MACSKTKWVAATETPRPTPPQMAPCQLRVRRAAGRARRWRAATVAGLYGLSMCLTSSAAVAQGIPLVRDTETENLLKDYSRPIFKAAGLGSHITMRIVKHESFNAFVVDGLNVFINTGTLLQAKTPNEVIGVIAHETGHITGGHLAALRTRIARDQTKALLLMVLGIGAMIAGRRRAATPRGRWARPAWASAWAARRCSCARC